ncbi:hypothetical protein BO70DRAFT_379405 [Aspergillus heteromorphus CBS 117.55]|uniref:ER membrane protein complex subunit 6 n=1 Tax=Aspergillus heteromorphus CBS 117.55 TaxID=1448321 RepID=A0A317WAB7_9EURO|nr:uncharacterized protein BO70DRAFT_379405 [Aspergillus heteromorphus CBS 117.55]PWY82835.1 hypothetical protein BO70DRAFT_379405 [Aspergillus heteromorphus CBS 117.55]
MPLTKQEISLLINPLVPESVQHNNRTLSSLHSLTSFLLGLTAGILSLQSATGFLFYLLGTVLVSALFHGLLLYRSGGIGAGAFFAGSNGGEIEGIDERGVVGGSGSGSGDGKGKGKGMVRKGAWRDVWFGGACWVRRFRGSCWGGRVWGGC